MYVTGYGAAELEWEVPVFVLLLDSEDDEELSSLLQSKNDVNNSSLVSLVSPRTIIASLLASGLESILRLGLYVAGAKLFEIGFNLVGFLAAEGLLISWMLKFAAINSQ